MTDRWSHFAKEFYGARATDKDSDRYHRLFAEAFAQLPARLDIADSGAVLDIGCGAGGVAGALFPSTKHYCGIDLCSVSLAVARRRHPGASFVRADMTEFSTRRVFDAAVAITSLEFCWDKAAALARIHESVKPGGRLYIEVRNARFLIWRLLWPLISLSGKTPADYSADGFADWSIAQWHGVLENTGFEVTTVGRALRPGSPGVSWIKRAIIGVIRATTPVGWHYMVGLQCVRR